MRIAVQRPAFVEAGRCSDRTARPVKVAIRNVSKVYRSGAGNGTARFFALQDISFDVREGEFVSFVGPSGCGKSTLINLIAGFERPDEGQVLFEDRPVTKSGPDRMVIFQEHGLLPWCSVRANIEFGLRCGGVARRERAERAEHYMKMVHLSRFQRSYPAQLSGGMKQRVAIARALAVEPSMLLMDEPFSSLDHRTRDLLHLELEALWMKTRKTIVFVSHSVEEALRLSDYIVVMASQPGRIRRIIKVDLPRPRDFFDPRLAALRGEILSELEDELNRLVQKEGDRDWIVKEGALRGRGGPGVDSSVGDPQ